MKGLWSGPGEHRDVLLDLVEPLAGHGLTGGLDSEESVLADSGPFGSLSEMECASVVGQQVRSAVSVAVKWWGVEVLEYGQAGLEAQRGPAAAVA